MNRLYSLKEKVCGTAEGKGNKNKHIKDDIKECVDEHRATDIIA